ncbi:hypothetical protein ACSFCM_15025 [Enterococcus gilvus]
MKTIAAARGDDSKFGLFKKEAIEYDVHFYRLRLFGHFLKTKASPQLRHGFVRDEELSQKDRLNRH